MIELLIMFLISKDLWEVRGTKEKGRGIFAKKDITAGTIIGDYLGKVIKTAEDDIYEDEDEGLYLMYYHDYASIFPNIKEEGIHLLNNSCTPNCWMYTYRGHTLFFTLRKVFKGEELTISYLLAPDDDCNPCTHLCKCGSKFCTGTMHLSHARYDKWADFHAREEKATKVERVRYGRDLPVLDEYPKNISDDPIYTLFGSDQKPAQVLENETLPKPRKIREIIRETGREVLLPKLNLKVFGVNEDKIYFEKSN